MIDEVFIGQTCILNLVAKWFFLKRKAIFKKPIRGYRQAGVYIRMLAAMPLPTMKNNSTDILFIRYGGSYVHVS